MASVIGTVAVALITTIGTIVNTLISKKTDKKIEKIDSIKSDFNKQIANLNENFTKKINNIKLENDKTYLTDFLSDLDAGITKSDIQIKRAYEIYEEYIGLNGNSYIHNRWEEFVKEGVL